MYKNNIIEEKDGSNQTLAMNWINKNQDIVKNNCLYNT